MKIYSLPDSQRAVIYYKLSLDYSEKNLDSAVWSANQAINLCIQRNYADLLSATCLQQGVNYIKAYKFDSAYSCLNSSINAYTKANNHAKLYEAYNAMSRLYQVNEIWDKAWQYSQKALEVYNQYGNTDSISVAFVNEDIASIYAGLNDVKQAEYYYKTAKEGFALIGNKHQIGSCFLQMAVMHFSMQKNFAVARQELDSALYNFTAEDEFVQVAGVYKAYGNYYLLQGNTDEAERNFKLALDIYYRNGSQVDIEMIKIGLGKIQLNRAQLNTARTYAKECYDFFKARDYKNQRLETILLLSEIDKRLGFKKRAYTYLDEYRNVTDSIKLLNGELRARDQMIQYGLTVKEKDNEPLKSLSDKKNDKFTVLLVSGIVILLTSILLALLFTQKNAALKEVKNLQVETEQKNVELEKLHRESEEKNKELTKINSIKDRLISMIAHDIRSPLASLQNTIALTRENILNADEFTGLSRNLEGDIYNLRGMLDNMLLWSREQVVEITVNRVTFNIDEVINEIISMHQNSLSLKNITVHNYLQEKLEVASDKDMITAVFRNIFSNAVKFTGTGKNIYIQQMMLNNKIYISVRDEGQGINTETLARINNKEYISTRGTANEKGTGIGLIFCRELLEKLEEAFDITTLPSKGTSVTFSAGYK